MQEQFGPSLKAVLATLVRCMSALTADATGDGASNPTPVDTSRQVQTGLEIAEIVPGQEYKLGKTVVKLAPGGE